MKRTWRMDDLSVTSNYPARCLSEPPPPPGARAFHAKAKAKVRHLRAA